MAVNPTEPTRAAIYLMYTGQTIFTLGNATSATGVLYLVNRVSGWGIRTLEFLPQLVDFRPREGEPKDEPLITRAGLIQGFTSCVKILGVIVGGAVLTYAGRVMTSDELANSVNRVLYRN